jgi:hypothetical protein
MSDALGPDLTIPFEASEPHPRFGHIPSRLLGFSLGRLELWFEIFACAHRHDVCFDLDMPRLSIGQVFIGAGALGGHCRKPRFTFPLKLLERRQFLAYLREFILLVAPELAKPPFFGLGFLCSFGSRALGIDRVLCFVQDSLSIAIEFQQAVLMCKPLRGRRNATGRSDETVPSPQIPFRRDKALARFQVRLQKRTRGAMHDPDLAQAARQLLWRLDVHDQRLSLGRQRMIFGRNVEVTPVNARIGFERRFKIVPERRAERRFVARRNTNLIDGGRISAFIRDRKQLCDRLAFS